MLVRLHKLAWKIPVFAVVLIFLSAAAPASMPANHQRKSASLTVGASVPPYATKQGKALQGAALYISRVPGQRYY